MVLPLAMLNTIHVMDPCKLREVATVLSCYGSTISLTIYHPSCFPVVQDGWCRVITSEYPHLSEKAFRKAQIPKIAKASPPLGICSPKP